MVNRRGGLDHSHIIRLSVVVVVEVEEGEKTNAHCRTFPPLLIAGFTPLGMNTSLFRHP
jgi:hypothetical protein